MKFIISILGMMLLLAVATTSVVESTTTQCLVSTFSFHVDRVIPNGTLGAGPYVYNATTTATGAQGSNGASSTTFDFIAWRYGTTDSAAFTHFNFTGNYTVSNINGVSGDSFSGNYSGKGDGSPTVLVLYGNVGQGTGKYAGAIGAISLNGTQVGTVTSPTTSSGNGTYLLVAAIVMP